MIKESRGRWVIGLSLLFAFILTAIPLPVWASYWRPAWLLIVLIYWCMALPNRVGVGTSWATGVLLDVQQGDLLGQNALGFALVAFIVNRTHLRLRIFTLVQQAVLMLFFTLFYLFISWWIYGIIGVSPRSWEYWMPSITSMLLWPWLFIVLRDVRRKYRLS